jgi:hypothetical protein
VSKTGYRLIKLGINAQDLHESILARVDLTKNMSCHEGSGETHVQTNFGTNLSEKNNLVSFFFFLSTVNILTFDFVPSFGKTDTQSPSFTYFTNNSNLSMEYLENGATGS